MGVVAKFFTYARFVAGLVSRMVATLLHVGTCRFAEMTRDLLVKSHVGRSTGDEKLLGTENSGDAVEKVLAGGWVSASDEDEWEAGGRDLLDKNEKQGHDVSESSTEDELIELSDGDDSPPAITSLQSAKRRDGAPLRRFSAPDRMTSTSDTEPLLLPSK
jgi:hypothetical protein